MIPQATNAQEALTIAIQMEKRAIGLYERAQMLFSTPKVADALQWLLEEERHHLKTFITMLGDEGAMDEKGLLLSAQAADVLHPGGLMAAARERAFEDEHSLIAYAAREEESAVQHYQAFAEACTGEARETFLLIAQEEQEHLHTLNTLLESDT
ncbi:MAG: ferritin family protein [Christensenellales bacterium]|jgi:rubrerythrin